MSVLFGLAAAAPGLREINVETASAVPTPAFLGSKFEETAPPKILYNPIFAAVSVETGDVKAKLKKREACAIQPGG